MASAAAQAAAVDLAAEQGAACRVDYGFPVCRNQIADLGYMAARKPDIGKAAAPDFGGADQHGR